MIVVFVILGVGLLFIFFTYNTLVGKKNGVSNAFSTIDVQLKQRHDLIPNLISAVKAAMGHERGTLEKLVELRTKALSPGLKQKDAMDIENKITRELSGILVAVENYPQLKANENVVSLQRSLNEVESQIAAARRSFNSSVTEYNNALEMFPTNFFARMMGYTKGDLLLAGETERNNPNVGQLFNS